MDRFKVVVCGGGIAGVEGILRLHRLAGERVDITLLSPDPQLDYRPLAVLEPFGAKPHRRYAIDRIVGDIGAGWIPDRLDWVDREAQVVHSATGKSQRYDALLLAVGARPVAAGPFMEDFTSKSGPDAYRRLLQDVDAGRLTDLALVVPPGPSWPLPIYELALMTARHAREARRHLRISLIIPARRPLDVFGGNVSDTVSERLSSAGIEVYCSATVEMPSERRLVIRPANIELHPQLTVTQHVMTGPDVRGIPGDPTRRFLPIDLHCRVRETNGRVFAAGDATDFPIKHGGLSAQQADTAADGIAHLAGVGPRSEPLHPVLRGMLMTGGEPLYLSAHVIAGQGWSAEIYRQPPWPANEKVIATELGSRLRAMDAANAGRSGDADDLR